LLEHARTIKIHGQQVEVKARLEAAERLLRQHGRLPGGPSVG
jgi:hypothetical protein